MRIPIPATNMVPAVSASAQATFGTRNNRPCWIFPDSADAFIDVHGLRASDYGGGTITLDIEWAADTAIVGVGGFQAAIESTTPDADDLDADSFATAQAGSDTTASQAGETIVTSITLTQAQADNWQQDEMGRLRLNRDVSVGSNLSGDIHVFGAFLSAAP